MVGEYKMIEYLPQALSSLNTALTIGKAFVNIRGSAKGQESLKEFNNAIIKAQQQIISAQNEQSMMSAKVNELEQECIRLKNWDAERQKYVRTEIAIGVFAYIEKDFMGDLQSAHKYCCNCFYEYKKSTLQQFKISEGRRIGLSCHNGCPNLIFVNYKQTS